MDLLAPFRSAQRVADLPPTVAPPAFRPSTAGAVRGHTVTAAGERLFTEVTLGGKAAIPKKRGAQKWQVDAYVYRRAVPEVRYAMRFLGNACRQLVPYIAAISDDGDDIVDADTAGLPPDLVDTARALLARLLQGRPGGAAMIGPIVDAFEIAGECYLIGTTDPVTGIESWDIRSVREVEITAEGVWVRDGEGTGANRVKLDLSTAFVGRLWVQDPEFASWADSPMRPLLDTCEELLVLRKGVRAVSRSRIAGNGILLVPDELSQLGAASDDPDGDEDPDRDVFMDDLTENMTTPIANEGAASAVVPMIARGPAEHLKELRHLKIERTIDPATGDREKAAQGRLGIGLDIPPEIITGYADVNHWTGWLIDASTYRYHVAPISDTALDSLTVTYLRDMLTRIGRWTPQEINRVLIASDPSKLVQSPNRGQDAGDLHKAGVLADRVYVEAKGFDPDNDMPTTAEKLERLALERGAMDGAITEALLRLGFGPLIDVLRTTPPGQITAHTGVDVQDTEAAKPAVSAPAAIEAPAADPAVEAPAEDTDDEGDDDEGTPGEPITASAAPTTAQTERLSRRLMDIDRRLRDRLVAAADAAVGRALERAGNRLRSAAQGDEDARTACAGVPGERVPAALGGTRVRALVASLGSDEAALLADTFDRLRSQWDEWTAAAQEEAIDAAVLILGIDRSGPDAARAIGELRDLLAEAADQGWARLADDLSAAAAANLYDPTAPDGEPGETPGTLVPPGIVRAALAVAGGLAADHAGLRRDGTPVDGRPVGGIGTGDLLSSYLRDGGSEIVEYEWAYGISGRPFPPHARLDGVRFTDWTDPALATDATTAWIGASFAPGDHKGCHCDYMPHWSDGRSSRADIDAIGDAAGGLAADQARAARAARRAAR